MGPRGSPSAAAISALPPEERQNAKTIKTVVSMLNALDPMDELEGMLASQMTINQLLITKFLPRLVHPE